MNPATLSLLRKICLVLTLLIVLVNVLGMLEVIPKVVPPRELNIVAFVLILFAVVLRRRGTGPTP